jgi:hypothetical protein
MQAVADMELEYAAPALDEIDHTQHHYVEADVQTAPHLAAASIAPAPVQKDFCVQARMPAPKVKVRRKFLFI